MKTSITFAVYALLGNIQAHTLQKHPQTHNYIQTKGDDDFDSQNLFNEMKEIRENTAIQYDSQDAENLMDSVLGDNDDIQESLFLQMSNGTIKEVDPIDETMNMIQNQRRFRPNSFADMSYHQQFEYSPEYIKQTRDNDEVTSMMEEQAKNDAQNVQIDESDSDSESSSDDENMVQMPHENDTEDIAEATNPENYDHKHSKAWNQLVDKKAQEMEDLEAIQVNMKKKAKQAKEDAATKAARERANEHQTRLVQLEKKARNQKFKNPSVDFGELYGTMAPDLLQLSALDHDNDTDDLVETAADVPKPVVEEPEQDEE